MDGEFELRGGCLGVGNWELDGFGVDDRSFWGK